MGGLCFGDDAMHDEFAGMGGSYALDPKTGKRRLLDRTDHAAPQQVQPKAPDAPPANTQPDAKE